MSQPGSGEDSQESAASYISQAELNQAHNHLVHTIGMFEARLIEDHMDPNNAAGVVANGTKLGLEKLGNSGLMISPANLILVLNEEPDVETPEIFNDFFELVAGYSQLITDEDRSFLPETSRTIAVFGAMDLWEAMTDDSGRVIPGIADALDAQMEVILEEADLEAEYFEADVLGADK